MASYPAWYHTNDARRRPQGVTMVFDKCHPSAPELFPEREDTSSVFERVTAVRRACSEAYTRPRPGKLSGPAVSYVKMRRSLAGFVGGEALHGPVF
jgi:hypothetical protein